MPQKQRSKHKHLAIPFTVDLISDLNLETTEGFTWEGKATSLFCVVAGNLASDIEVLEQALKIIGESYRGVFFIDGQLEHQNLHDYEDRVDEIKSMIRRVDKVIYLHNHVVILNGTAFVAINGWNVNTDGNLDDVERFTLQNLRHEDTAYLKHTVKSLQLHSEAKKLVVISSTIPSKHLALGDPSLGEPEAIEPILGLYVDTEKKVESWIFGGFQNLVDGNFQGVRYTNNPRMIDTVYQPKRIVV